MATLRLDEHLTESCHELAASIARSVSSRISDKTTTSVERSVARLLGVDDVDSDGVPIPNVLVDQLAGRGALGRGLAYWMGNAMLATGRTPAEIAALVANRQLDLLNLEDHSWSDVHRAIEPVCRRSVEVLGHARQERRRLRQAFPEPARPARYVLTATGNVYEDVVHSKAAADHGADIIAVIRSTAQSLLDHVPYGPTTEGYGGTYATQANFRILRSALDEWCHQHGRYVELSSFCSGLCMPEIAVIGVLEGVDNMVNDALYGILYRNINCMRTMVDQRVSRLVNSYFGVVINTGEDNYLRTADAVEAAPSVTASQLINYHLARESRMPDEQIAVGDAFEIHPSTRNGLLYQLAQAQLTRQLFPSCPVKYMPPTRHMDGNPYRTHAANTLFSLVSIITGQGIQTIGVPTEGAFTPHIHDRVHGLNNVNYVYNFAADLAADLEFRSGGLIESRAQDVLRSAHDLLAEIENTGLFKAIEHGVFGNISRRDDEGRGREGMLQVSNDYMNPFLDLLMGPRHAS